MAEFINIFNTLLGIGAIVLQIFVVITLFLLFFGPKENKYLSFIKNYFIQIGFFLAVAPLLVLVYSEIVGYVPCYHCWIQRIFLFPQAFLFGTAWVKKDRGVVSYSWPLLLVGFLDAIYLTYIYYWNPSSAPCDATGVSCAQRYVSEFGGYISIPTLSLTMFVALLTIVLVVKFYKREEYKVA